jgi:hypothetical protein
MSRAERHTISGNTDPAETILWLSQHGYVGVGVGGPGRGVALLFGRLGEVARIATIGSTLVYWKHMDHIEVERG